MRRTTRTALLLLSALAAPAQTVEFLHLSDTHLITASALDTPTGGQRLLLGGAAPLLQGYLSALRANPPAFLLHTGDIVDGYGFYNASGGLITGQIEFARSVFEKAPTPVYLTLGNHDVSVYRPAADGKGSVKDLSAQSQARAAWSRAVPCFRQGTYYTFTRDAGSTRYLFLVLDNSDPGDAAYAAAQAKWIAAQLKEPQAAAIVVAIHIPPAADPVSKALLTALAAAGRPALILCGHRHTDAIDDLASGGLIVRTGSFLTPPLSSRRIVLRPDRIDVSETGAPERVLRSIPIPQRAATSNQGASAASRISKTPPALRGAGKAAPRAPAASNG
jgi:hypothetical protein